VEVVDAAQQTIDTYSVAGKRISTRGFSVPVAISKAVPVGSTWAIGGADSVGYRVFAVDADGQVRTIYTRAAEPGTRLAPAVHLGSAGRDLLLTDLDAPYTVRRIALDGHTVASFSPSADAIPALQADGRPGQARWVSLPAVFFGEGFVQTIADLTSDRRLLVAYGPDGKQRSASLIDAPLGISGATPDLRYLIGVRGANAPEIVLYRWRWRTL
jgi:hypothetical protein